MLSYHNRKQQQKRLCTHCIAFYRSKLHFLFLFFQFNIVRCSAKTVCVFHFKINANRIVRHSISNIAICRLRYIYRRPSCCARLANSIPIYNPSSVIPQFYRRDGNRRLKSEACRTAVHSNLADCRQGRSVLEHVVGICEQLRNISSRSRTMLL